VALVTSPDTVLYHEAFGKRSVTGNVDATPDTIFRIASMTKRWIDPQRQIAAVVLMQVLPYYDEKCLDVLRGFERTLYRVIG
jgi:CubicO group peptidase (beta-lactamase class C family)